MVGGRGGSQSGVLDEVMCFCVCLGGRGEIQQAPKNVIHCCFYSDYVGIKILICLQKKYWWTSEGCISGFPVEIGVLEGVGS